MAIFSPKWEMIWRKENIFFNDSWHVGYGSILGPFEVLEVPKTDNLPIVWPGLSKTPAPFIIHTEHFHPKSGTNRLAKLTLDFLFGACLIIIFMIAVIIIIIIMMSTGESPVWGLHAPRNPLAAPCSERDQVIILIIIVIISIYLIIILIVVIISSVVIIAVIIVVIISTIISYFHLDFRRHRQALEHHLQVIFGFRWLCFSGHDHDVNED